MVDVVRSEHFHFLGSVIADQTLKMLCRFNLGELPFCSTFHQAAGYKCSLEGSVSTVEERVIVYGVGQN